MILGKNISNVYSRGNEIQRVFSYGKLVWEKLSEDYNGVVFTAEETNSTIGLAKLSTNQTLEYRTDYTNWQEMTANTVITLYNIGDRAYIRGELSADNSTSNYTQFTMSGRISASGNINYIWSKNNLDAPLKAYCGINMFKRTTLITAPELPATILSERCYGDLFAYTPLITAPELPAKELAPYCYYGMFYTCENLTQAPELPATILAPYCYTTMFDGCYALEKAPALPATTLADSCYRRMFYNCENLTQAPELPATTLANSCYYAMFSGATNITQAPTLPATTLVTQCYMYMFSRCSNLNYIKCLATDISAKSCTNTWVELVSETGTFIQAEGFDWRVGVSGIPEGWVVEVESGGEDDDDINGVCFTAEEANSTIKVVSYPNHQTLEYKTVSSDWQNMTRATVLTLNNIGDKVYIRGEMTGDNTLTTYLSFKMTGKISASGNCNYIWSKNDLDAPLKQYCGYRMFYNCSSLTQAPELPATELSVGCYRSMFGGCSSLTQAPELPATTLKQDCYNSMFSVCSSLTQAPELPATTLVRNCYEFMFGKCYNLNYIKCLATDISATDCTEDWVTAVSSTGTFVAKTGANWGRGVFGIPENWTVQYI